jgi:hypothetical protein
MGVEIETKEEGISLISFAFSPVCKLRRFAITVNKQKKKERIVGK